MAHARRSLLAAFALLAAVASGAALAAPGDLDVTFNGGAGYTAVGFGRGHDVGQQSTRQADGRLVVAGQTTTDTGLRLFTVARYEANGTLDTTFGIGGLFQESFGAVESMAHAVAIQADGRIVAVGWNLSAGINSITAVRLLADGSLDPAFASGGRFQIQVAGNLDRAYAVAIQPDGAIVIGGFASSVSPRIAIIRLTPAGALDTAFGGGGQTSVNSSPLFTSDTAVASGGMLAIQTIAGQHYVLVCGSTTTAPFRGFLVRVRPDALVDTTFGTGGVLSLGVFNDNATWNAVAVDPATQQILVAGTEFSTVTNSSNVVALRLNPDGSPLAGFGNVAAGRSAFGQAGFDHEGFAIALDPLDNGLFVAGYRTTGTITQAQPFVARFLANGTLDTAFGGAGTYVVPEPGAGTLVGAVPTGTGGVTVSGDFAPSGENSDIFLHQVTAGGATDLPFGPGGTAAGDFSNFGAEVVAAARMPDGSLVAAANASTAGAILFGALRFSADGVPDAAFGNGGQATHDFGFGFNVASAVLPVGAGRIVVTGHAHSAPGANEDFAAVRFNADGTVDPTFHGTGGVLIDFAGLNDESSAAALSPSGKIVIAGITGTANGADVGIVRLDENGFLDATFNGTGRFSFTGPGLASQVTSVVVLADESILVAGWTNVAGTNYFLAKITPAGALDVAFGTGGMVNGRADPLRPAFFNGLGVLANGNIVAGGTSGDGEGATGPFTARFLPNGTLDTSYGTGGHHENLAAGFSPNALVVEADGRTVALGTAFAGATGNDFAFYRTNPAGGPDTIFGVNGRLLLDITGGDEFARNGFVLPDGRLVVVGAMNALGVIFRMELGTGATDTDPDPFTFPTQNGIVPGSIVTSAAVAITGIDTPSTISVANGLYSIGCTTTFTATPGLVNNGQSVCVRHTASALFSTATVTTLTVGTVSGTFTTVTAGPQPAVTLNATQYGFGTRDVGVTASSPLIRLTNSGAAPLAIAGLAAVGEGFALANSTCGAALAPAAQCTFNVTFSPPREGPLEGAVQLATNAPGSPHAILLSGTGVDLNNPLGDADGDGIPNGVEGTVNTNPRAKDNDVFANARLFAMQQYRDFLAREGDAAGIDFWISQINTGARTRGQMIESFFGSTEFQGAIAPVARLYFAYFLRIPDYGGLTFWIGQYRAGTSLAAISEAFATSGEFTSRYGALTNTQFVTLVYQNVLGRAPDAGGLAFWTGQLAAGALTRGQMMVGFSESAEYQGLIANEVYVTMMYVGMLRRSPDAAGFAFWVNYMDTGNAGIALIDGFLGAPEYRLRFLP